MDFSKLISEIVSKKELRFTHDDARVKFPEFLENGQLFIDHIKIAGKDIAIRPTVSFLEAIHQYFSPLYQFNLSNDIGEIMDFIKKIEEHFDGNNRYGITVLSKSLTQYLLQLSATSFDADLTAYALTIHPDSMENKDVIYFDAYMTLLPELTLSFEKIWEVERYFAIDLGIPEPGNYDTRWATLVENLTKIIASGKHAVPVIIQTISSDRADSRLTPLVNSSYRALKDSGGFSLSELLSWLDDSQLQKNAIEILIFSAIGNVEDAERIFNKLQTINITKGEDILLLPRLYCHILDNADESTSKKVIDRLQQLILGEDSTMVRTTISAMAMYNISIGSFDGCFKELLESGKYIPEYNNNFNTLFSRHLELSSFVTFLTNYAMVMPAAVAPTPFEIAIGLHKQKDRVAFEKAMLLLLIHKNGSVRWFAHRIIFSGFQFSEKASLEFDPLSLDRTAQYKLIIALSVPFQRIHYTVPIIARFLNSQDELLLETALCKLEELIYSYKADVLVELDLAIPKSNPKKNEWMVRLQESLRQLNEEISLKDGILELNPQYAQPNLFKDYLDIYSKKSSAAMEAARKSRKGIFEIAKNVSIARGGGWKIPSGEVQPLSKLSFSWAMARTMFINPEAMDNAMKTFYQTDWENEFKEWEQKIL